MLGSTVGGMTEESRKTFENWQDRLLDMLRSDAVHLCQIVGAARDEFALEGRDVVEFTRRAVAAVLDAGGMPVKTAADASWVADTKYGRTKANMVDNIVDEWLALGRDPDLGDLWFALPDSIGVVPPPYQWPRLPGETIH